MARINYIQIALSKYHSRFLVDLEKELVFQLNDIFKKERLIWAQKAGLNWRKFGDYNTKYFHILAQVRKSRGKILTLKDNEGTWITDLDSLKDLAVSYFDSIFRTTLSKSALGVSYPNNNLILRKKF